VLVVMEPTRNAWVPLAAWFRYYNTVRPHRGLGRRTPGQAYADRPKAVPTGPVIPAHYRVRTDTIDTGGSVTVRHNSRLHHIGLGARLAGTPISLLINDLHIRVIHRHTGELIRELILDPTRDYQPRGLPPGPPKQTAAAPRPASRSRPKVPPAAGVTAGRRPPEGPRP
jgi:Integrase core domain